MSDAIRVSGGTYVYLPGLEPRRDQGWTNTGLEALVGIGAYDQGAGLRWCRFEYTAPGDAAVYPFNVRIPGKGVGQFKSDEIRCWRVKGDLLVAGHDAITCGQALAEGWPT